MARIIDCYPIIATCLCESGLNQNNINEVMLERSLLFTLWAWVQIEASIHQNSMLLFVCDSSRDEANEWFITNLLYKTKIMWAKCYRQKMINR